MRPFWTHSQPYFCKRKRFEGTTGRAQQQNQFGITLSMTISVSMYLCVCMCVPVCLSLHPLPHRHRHTQTHKLARSRKRNLCRQAGNASSRRKSWAEQELHPSTIACSCKHLQVCRCRKVAVTLKSKQHVASRHQRP